MCKIYSSCGEELHCSGIDLKRVLTHLNYIPNKIEKEYRGNIFCKNLAIIVYLVINKNKNILRFLSCGL
jgi:hypothetical protein